MSDTTTSVAAQVAALSSLPTPDLWALWDRFFKRRPENPNRNYTVRGHKLRFCVSV